MTAMTVNRLNNKAPGRGERKTVRALGYGLEDVIEAIQDPDPDDFQVSTAAHSPRIPGV